MAQRPYGFRILGPAHEPGERLRARLQGLLTASIVLAHLVGAAVVIILNVWVVPHPGLLDTSERGVVVVLTPAYVLAALTAGVWWGTRRELPRLRWASDERPPSAAERQAALLAPARLLVVQVVPWLGAVVLFGAVAVPGGGLVVLRTALTTLLGGTVTCAYAYLLSELSLRPLAARAMSAGDGPVARTPGLGVRTLLVWVVGTGAPAAGLLIVATLVLVDHGVTVTALAWTVIGLTALLLAVGLSLLALATKAIVDPVRALDRALRRVEAGDLDTRIVVYDGSEIGRAQSTFNQMVVGLEERARIRDLFGRHVGDEVAEAALRRGVHLGGEQCGATALFVDLVGSTSIAEREDPGAVVEMLNAFYAEVVEAVEACGGWINKFEGDAALCVFGPPGGLPSHETAALVAAGDLRRRLDRFTAERGVEAGVGVASGLVVAGNVGTSERYEYTVIGDPVNVAARLSELAKDAPGGILIAESTVEAADPKVREAWAELDRTVLRGRSAATLLYGVRRGPPLGAGGAPVPRPPTGYGT